MIPLRFLILVVLVYIAWRLLRKSFMREKIPAEEPEESKYTEVQDVLVEDPVCHVLIPEKQALRLRKNKVTYYFCSEKCCDQFIQEAEKEKNEVFY